MKRGENMKIKSMVNDFLVWRAASSVDWDCTAIEIAAETGLSDQTVLASLRRKGWIDRVNKSQRIGGGTEGRLPVDSAMRVRSKQQLGRV